jgi:hypothetical protein
MRLYFFPKESGLSMSSYCYCSFFEKVGYYCYNDEDLTADFKEEGTKTLSVMNKLFEQIRG